MEFASSARLDCPAGRRSLELDRVGVNRRGDERWRGLALLRRERRGEEGRKQSLQLEE